MAGGKKKTQKFEDESPMGGVALKVKAINRKTRKRDRAKEILINEDNNKVAERVFRVTDSAERGRTQIKQMESLSNTGHVPKRHSAATKAGVAASNRRISKILGRKFPRKGDK